MWKRCSDECADLIGFMQVPHLGTTKLMEWLLSSPNGTLKKKHVVDFLKLLLSHKGRVPSQWKMQNFSTWPCWVSCGSCHACHTHMCKISWQKRFKNDSTSSTTFMMISSWQKKTCLTRMAHLNTSHSFRAIFLCHWTKVDHHNADQNFLSNSKLITNRATCECHGHLHVRF